MNFIYQTLCTKYLKDLSHGKDIVQTQTTKVGL